MAHSDVTMTKDICKIVWRFEYMYAKSSKKLDLHCVLTRNIRQQRQRQRQQQQQRHKQNIFGRLDPRIYIDAYIGRGICVYIRL